MGFRYNPARRLGLFFFPPIRASCRQIVSLAPPLNVRGIHFLEKSCASITDFLVSRPALWLQAITRTERNIGCFRI